MPRPPILPVPDRKAIFESGIEYRDWLGNEEYAEQLRDIQNIYYELELDADERKAVASLNRDVYVIVIAEPWCGDVIRHVPYLVKLAEASANQIKLRFLQREDAPDYFARFLTNGGEAIPKFVFCADNFNEVGNWGPMSTTPRRMIAIGKALDQGGEARKRVAAFYEQDNGRERKREILDLIAVAAAGSHDI